MAALRITSLIHMLETQDTRTYIVPHARTHAYMHACVIQQNWQKYKKYIRNCFQSVAVNSVYKLQFFTVIFAVLLPVFSRHILSFSV